MIDALLAAPRWFWPSVGYFGFALATFGWIGCLTYRDRYDAPALVARVLCTVLWPLYWGAALGCWLYDLTCEWKARRRWKHERHD